MATFLRMSRTNILRFFEDWDKKNHYFFAFIGFIQLVMLPWIQKALIFKIWSSIKKIIPKILLGYRFQK